MNDDARVYEGTMIKFSNWAANLSDDIDFMDYWYNLFKSNTKARIESSWMDNINAFWWTRWCEDFEVFVDKYQPLGGAGYERSTRDWYARYMQYLIYSLQMTSKEFATVYDKDVFLGIMENWFKYHTISIDQAVARFVEEFGNRTGREVRRLYM